MNEAFFALIICKMHEEVQHISTVIGADWLKVSELLYQSPNNCLFVNY